MRGDSGHFRVRTLTRSVKGLSVALVVGLLLAACGSAGSSNGGGGGGGGGSQEQSIYFAEGPGANPNYIFPYMGCAYFSVSNINQFQFLMYRPLYWFGLGASTPSSTPCRRDRAVVLQREPHDHD